MPENRRRTNPRRLPTTLVAVAAGLLVAAPLRADDVWVATAGRKPLRYGSVKVRGYRAGHLVFLGRMGGAVLKPLTEVTRIQVEGQDELNLAENLYAEGQFPEAAKAYQSLVDVDDPDWIAPFAHARLVVCHDETGQFAQAVASWVKLLEVWPVHAVARPPVTLGAKGSQVNKQALTRLTAVLKRELQPAAARSAKELQLALWKIEGDPRAEAAKQALAEKTAEKPEPGPDRETRPERAQPDRAGNVAILRSQASRLAQTGRYEEALPAINRAVAAVSQASAQRYLPGLLTLKATCHLGRAAELEKAGRTDAATRHRVSAGLAAMRVVTFFPENPAMIECLYLAGRVHEEIGQTKLAITLYRECKEYAVGRNQATWEKQATDALERLDVKPGATP